MACRRRSFIPIGLGLAGRMIAPRSRYIQVGHQLWRKMLRNRLTSQLGLPLAAIQHLGHQDAAEQRIRRSPGARRIAQNAEFEWKPVAMRSNVGIDSASVGLEMFAITSR